MEEQKMKKLKQIEESESNRKSGIKNKSKIEKYDTYWIIDYYI